MKPAIVFRGNILSLERAEYDREVDVYFQSSASMDNVLNMQWVSGDIDSRIRKSRDEVIFADNVAFQQDNDFH